MTDVLDPNSLASAAFNRRAFVGQSVGAAASAAGAARAQRALEFGKPHAPITASNDPEIAAEHAFLDATHSSYVATAADACTESPAWFRIYIKMMTC